MEGTTMEPLQSTTYILVPQAVDERIQQWGDHSVHKCGHHSFAGRM
jgi:hypothetical protein